MAGKNNNNTPDNGAELKEQIDAILGGIETLSRNQSELNDRLSDLEEGSHNKDGNSTKVELAHMYMKPPDEYLMDLSRIPPLAIRSIAEALTLDEMTNPRVRNGEISLNKLLIQNWLHGLRGNRGFILHLVADAMREQVSAEASPKEDMPEFEAGRE